MAEVDIKVARRLLTEGLVAGTLMAECADAMLAVAEAAERRRVIEDSDGVWDQDAWDDACEAVDAALAHINFGEAKGT